MATSPRTIPRAALARAFGDDHAAIRAMEMISRDVSEVIPGGIADAQQSADDAAAAATAAQSLAENLSELEFVALTVSPLLAPNVRQLTAGAGLALADGGPSGFVTLDLALTQTIVLAALGFDPVDKAGDTMTGRLIVDDEIEAGGLSIAEGANARMGMVTLAAGAASVSTAAIGADSRVFLTAQTPSGTPGALYVSARTPGVDFAIASTSAADTSDVAWLIVEPAP